MRHPTPAPDLFNSTGSLCSWIWIFTSLPLLRWRGTGRDLHRVPLLTPTGVTRVAKHHPRPGPLFDFPIGEAMAEPMGGPLFHCDTFLAFPIGEAMAEPLG